MKLATICVTHGRPDRAKKCFESWKSTIKFDARDGKISDCSDFWFVVDESDLLSHHTPKQLYKMNAYQTIVPSATNCRRGMCDPSNFAAQELVNHYDAIQFVADDFEYLTPDWDEKFKEKYDEFGGTIIWYGDDLLQRENLPTSYIMSTNICKKLGYICNPAFQHLFIDNWAKKLGEETGTLCYDPRVIIEHQHPSAGKAEWDANYRIVQGLESQDLEVYKTRLVTDMLREVELIRELKC